MKTFVVYPAIDLRAGKVVRLSEGDPDRQTTYGSDPAATARQWLTAGASWLHVVNLDGAFGDDDRGNNAAIRAILAVCQESPHCHIQVGGGVRTMEQIDAVLGLGVSRVILGTVAVESPELVAMAINKYGPERIVIGIDARGGMVRVRGWREDGGQHAVDLARQLGQVGVETIIYTDIAKDGLQQGVSLAPTQALAEQTGLSVIASGGVATLDDIRVTKTAGLAGIIVGRALYEQRFSLSEALSC